MSAMEVDLLTNALLPNVEPASGGVEPPVGGGRSDSAIGIEGTEAAANGNDQIASSGNLANEKPSKGFAETLEEKIQVEAPEAADNTESAVPPDMASTFTAEQTEPISSEVSADLLVKMGKIVVEEPDIVQEQAVSADSQLLTSAAVISTPLEATAGQAEAATIPSSVQSAVEVSVLTVEQGQVQPQIQELSQGMPEVTAGTQIAPAAQIAHISQAGAQDTSDEGVVVGEKTAVEENTVELPNELLGKGDMAVVSGQKVGDAMGPNVSSADPTSQDSADAGKEASSDPKGDSAKADSGATVAVFGHARARADAEEQTDTLPQSSENNGKDVFDSEEAGETQSSVQKLDPGQVESVVSKSNGPETHAPEADNSLELEQAVPAETPQVSVPEQSSGVQASDSPESPQPGDNAASVSEQIRESITSTNIGPDQEITIRLNPPELGTVVVKFQEQDNQITGILEVSKSQTRAEIQQVLPEITRDLQDFGVQIRRIEVVMASNGESETLSGQSAMPQWDRWAGEEGPQGFEPDAPSGSVGGAFPGNTAYAGSGAYNQSYVSDKSIDMFV